MPNMKLVLSILRFLREESKSETHNPDTQESLEVAVQCLETAYDINPSMTEDTPTLPLEIMFKNFEYLNEEAEDADCPEAEAFKTFGNNCMKGNQYAEAVRNYTKAINKDNTNAIYYCNRAAAYSKLNDFQNAIKDCKKAIEMDPLYAKAYGRMGLAYSSLDQYDAAIKAFKQAAELDPFNESYMSNLKLVMEKKEKAGPQIGASGGGSAQGGLNVDWQNLFSNSDFRNMASTIMQDPNIINALTGLSNSAPPGNAAGAGNPPNSNTAPNLDGLLEAGQYLANQIRAANPGLIDQFQQVASNFRNPANPEDKDPPVQ